MCPMRNTTRAENETEKVLEHLLYFLYKRGNNLSSMDYFIKFLSAATGDGCYICIKKPGKEILHVLPVIFRVMQVQLSSP